MSDFWDESGFVPPTESYVNWDDVGTKVSGKIVDMKAHRFKEDESPVPKLIIDTGEEEPVEVTCGPRNLKSLVMSERPSIGDNIVIEYTGKNGRTKMFTVDISKVDASTDNPLD